MSRNPILIFDGDCGFCRFWVARWRAMTGGRIEARPSQDVAGDFPSISPDTFRRTVVYVDGETAYEGAEAVFRSLAVAPLWRWPLALYRRAPLFASACEASYRFIAARRVLFSWLTRLLWGRGEPDRYEFSTWLFLRLLGSVYFVAFLSLGEQILGLVGSQGILPAQSFLDGLAQHGPARYWRLPTFFWLGAGDSALTAGCVAGMALSLVLIAGLFPAGALIGLWALYLSYMNVGGEFLGFQWDALLVETGFLAIFLAPLRVLPASPGSDRAPLGARWLLRWLLFRLMFMSGVVKLASGDPVWRNLTALDFHYFTQPLPAWTSWYAHQLPSAFQKASTAAMFAVELILPWFLFAPQRLRRFACWGILVLEVLIMSTGNYCFFNFLCIALAFLSLGDGAWPPAVLGAASRWEARPAARWRWPVWIVAPVGAVVLVVSVAQMSVRLANSSPPEPLRALMRAAAPFHSVNPYGLFAVMTTERMEIIVEGSNDGREWKAYDFRYKPDDPRERPAFVAPHQPRLDWQMWFAALSDVRGNRWFISFCARLLEGSPEVLKLLRSNPFPEAPPRFIRAVGYDYRFADPAQKKRGFWWHRTEKGLYCPPLSLRREQ